MHTILEIPKPGFHALTPDLLDPRIVVAARGTGSRDADPVLVRGVVENDLRFRVGGQVAEFGAVRVGEEEEVRTAARGDGHGAGDGLGRGWRGVGLAFWMGMGRKGRGVKTYANPIPICPQHADLLLIHDSVEVLELLLGRDVVVPLFSDGGVLALVDFLSGQGLGHFWTGSDEERERERAGEEGERGFGGLGRMREESRDCRVLANIGNHYG